MATWRARFRLSIREAACLVAIAALTLALVVQGIATARRERALERAAREAGRTPRALQRMDRLLTPLGRYLLAEARTAEVLTVAPMNHTGFPEENIQPTGRTVPPATLRAVADALLDPQNYMFSNLDDFPDPTGGLRIRRGSDTLDILWYDSGGAAPGHQDIWFRPRDATGRILHNQGQNYDCFGDARLQQAIRSLATPVPVVGTQP